MPASVCYISSLPGIYYRQNYHVKYQNQHDHAIHQGKYHSLADYFLTRKSANCDGLNICNYLFFLRKITLVIHCIIQDVHF